MFDFCDAILLWEKAEIDNFNFLNEVSLILAEFSWIYEIRNTEILIFEVLEKIPEEWYDALSKCSTDELCAVLFGKIQDSWPQSLKNFIHKCCHWGSLRFPPTTFYESEKSVKQLDKLARRISPKKDLEVRCTSVLINRICEENGCQAVIDVGSGLGYLDRALHRDFRICSIGLDCKQKYTNTAAMKQDNKESCTHAIKHRTLEVKYSTECMDNLESIIKEVRTLECICDSDKKAAVGSPVMMVGLHSCGDLAQDMMQIFNDMPEIKLFLCIGCCYIKVDLQHFPMSRAAQTCIANTQQKYSDWQPSVSGLRLACHATRSQIAPSVVLADRFLFYRALFELHCQTENISWKQPKRHIRESHLSDFKTYCEKMIVNMPHENTEDNINKLMNLYQQKMHLFPRVKILLVLQTLLQPLWESFVILDRKLFFEEKNIFAKVIAMWDDSKSSRNLALFACKN